MSDPPRRFEVDPRERVRSWLDAAPPSGAAAARARIASRLARRRVRLGSVLALAAAAALALWLVPGRPPVRPGASSPPEPPQPPVESSTLIVVLSSGTRLVVPLSPAR